MLADYWAHYYFDNPDKREEIVDDDFDLDDVLAQIDAEAEETTDWEDLTDDGNQDTGIG